MRGQLSRLWPPYLECVPLVEGQLIALCGLEAVYRATDSMPPSPSPGSRALSRASSFLLPLQSRTVFLCFESVFVLLKLRPRLPLTGETGSRDVPEQGV